MRFSYLLLPCFIFFLASTSSMAEETDSNSEKDEFLHFGNMGGLLPTLELDDFPEPNSDGAKLVHKYCGQCHNPPGPGMRTEKEWTSIFWRMYWRSHVMKKEFKTFEVPNYNQGQVMFLYLKEHSLASIKSNDVDKREAGASKYLRICMQCHELPDPKQHAPNEWKSVVQRMKRHMHSMSKAAPNTESTNVLIKYLKKLSVQQ